MYDTIYLQLNKDDIGESYNWRKVLAKIHQTCEFTQVPGGCGYLRNIRVSATEKRVLCIGSFPKYLMDDNTYPMTMKAVQCGIKNLGDSLGIPMHKADVLLVDIASTFEMEKAPELYIQKMRSLSSFASNSWETSKYFLSRGVKVCFYDKWEESQQKKKSRSKSKGNSLLEKKNLLRYEVRFKKGKIRQMFGRGLKAHELCSRDIYWRFIAEWYGCYEDIHKLPDSVLDVSFDQIKRQEDFINWALCILNSYVPVSELVKQKFKLRENHQSTDRQYHKRLQDRIQEGLVHYQDYMVETDLVQELTRKIENFLTEKFEDSPDAYDKN